MPRKSRIKGGARKLVKKTTAKDANAPLQQTIKGPDDVDENFIKLYFPLIIGNLIKKYVTWSPIEASWLRMKDEAFTAAKLSLKVGVSRMLRKSFGGCFIRYMNKQEATTFDVTEKKYEMTEFMLKINERPIAYTRLNDFTEDIAKYLGLTVKDSFQKNGWISQKMLINNLPSIRLCFQKITEMDSSLQQYKNLLALIATSNYLKDFSGKLLPPNLNMLELFGNVMYDIVKLMESPPPLILYLGIGRNYLWRVSSLPLLETFKHLYFLDLSENDFVDIKDVLVTMSRLPQLKCLSLEGNPCSMPVSYVHIVQRMCPQVEYLDGIKYLKDFPVDSTKDDYRGVLQIHGIRFFHVPKPLKGRSKDYDKLEKFYQLECEIPLLDPVLRQHEARSLKRSGLGMTDPEAVPLVLKGIMELEPIPESEVQSSVARSIRESQTRQSKRAFEFEERILREKINKSYKRWLSKDVETPTQTTFLSRKVHWAKVMSFPSPCIEIPVDPEGWRQLRDSMRSIIIMRLYYKEVAHVKVHRPETKEESRGRRASRRASTRSSRRASRRASRRQSAKKQSIKRKSMKRSSKAAGKRQSMKRSSKVAGKRQSMKRSSKMAKGEKRQSMKRRGTQWSGGKAPKSGRRSAAKREEVLLVRNLIAKIPVPAEITKWNVPFMGFTWDIKERCLARRYPGIETEKYSGSSFSKTPGTRESRDGKRESKMSTGGKRMSRAGKRKSRVSTAGKRKSRTSSAGKRKSRAGTAGKRKSRASTAGKRKSRASTAGKRKSRASTAGKRKSRATTAGKRKSRGSTAGKGKSKGSSARKAIKEQLRRAPDILTCHIGIGLLRLGKEAPSQEKLKKPKKSIARKSKQSRKSKSPRKSKSGSQRKSMKRKSMKRSSKVAKK